MSNSGERENDPNAWVVVPESRRIESMHKCDLNRYLVPPRYVSPLLIVSPALTPFTTSNRIQIGSGPAF